MLSAFLPTAVCGVILSLEQRRRAVIWAEAIYNYFLLSYPIMTEFILATFVLVEGVGDVGLSAHCCMGGYIISGTATPGRHLGRGSL